MSDFEILSAMRKYGGGFVSALALACLNADVENLARIKEAFPELWFKYSAFADMDRAKRDKEKP